MNGVTVIDFLAWRTVPSLVHCVGLLLVAWNTCEEDELPIFSTNHSLTFFSAVFHPFRKADCQ